MPDEATIVIGAGIYETPPGVLKNVPGPLEGMMVWALGGILSLIGALCYAELASTYRRSGGDYVYLTRAYGPWMGFLFGWAQLVIIRTGNIGMMAYVFADYAMRLWDFGAGDPRSLSQAQVTFLADMRSPIVGVVSKGSRLPTAVPGEYGWLSGWIVLTA